MEIYIAKGDHRTGPFTVNQIETMISSGMVTISDMAWHDGLADWAPLHRVMGICPPLPPSDIEKSNPAGTNRENRESGKPAGFGLRFVAILIDNVVLFIFTFIISIAFGYFTQAKDETIFMFMNFSGFAVSFFYFSLMESSSRMATLGKMALGLIVVDYKGKRVRNEKAAARFCGKFISALILGIGYLMPLWTKNKQTLHDIMSSTLVIRK